MSILEDRFANNGDVTYSHIWITLYMYCRIFPYPDYYTLKLRDSKKKGRDNLHLFSHSHGIL